MTAKRSTPVPPSEEGAVAKPKRARKPAAERTDAKPAPAEDLPEAEDVLVGEDEGPSGEIAEPGWRGELRRIVVFGMEGQRYALPIEVVQEIQQIVAVSELPSEHGAVVGVINLRGQVVPAIDLRALVGMPARDYTLQTPMIFTRTPRGLVAMIVDDVEDVLEVPADCVQEPTGVYALADRLLGVCMLDTGLVFVFDVDALLPSSEDSGVARAAS